VTGRDTRSVLVTGAAGFVGTRVAAALAAADWRVTGLDLTAPVGPAFAASWRCDLLDERSLCELAMAGSFQAVVHLAGVLPGQAERRDLFAVNVAGTSAALAHFARPDCHFLLFSNGLVYGNQPGPFTELTPCNTTDPYAQSKLAAEALVGAWARESRSPAAILRPSVLYGNGAPPKMLLVSLLESLRKAEPFAMTAGEQTRDFLHVDDAAAAVVTALERRLDGTWNLASGESHRVHAAAELAAFIAGRPHLLRVGALPYRAGEVFDYRLDATAFRQAAGWMPHVTLAQGLQRLWKEAA
jgi:nucleoside-diphosphate-sugar epimerase